MTEETRDSAENEIEERLALGRAVPRAGFRAELRRELLTSIEATGWRPRRLRLLVTAYAGAGAALMLVLAIGVAGAGPLGA
jgi:hypothetical protein